MSFTKSVSANGYESVTVTAENLSLGASELIRICNVHLTYFASAPTFQIGCEISYRMGDNNRSVLVGLYNTTSTSRTYTIQCEVLTSIS